MGGGFTVQMGKALVILGGVLLVVGLLLMASSKFSFGGFGRLPGDITYKGKHGSFYFPLTTCVILSVVVTLVIWVISHLTRH